MRAKDMPRILAAALYEAAEGKAGNQLEKIVDGFCDYLAQKGLMKMIPSILDELELIYLKSKGMVVAKVSAKSKLDSMDLLKIKELVKAKTGRGVMVKEEVDERVIGGAVVRYGDKVLDFTLNNKIKNLAKELSN